MTMATVVCSSSSSMTSLIVAAILSLLMFDAEAHLYSSVFDQVASVTEQCDGVEVTTETIHVSAIGQGQSRGRLLEIHIRSNVKVKEVA